MADEFEPGELFVYTNGDRWELGMVKRPNGRGDGYFCWYSRGDTAANTPTEHMYKLSNAGFTHIEQMLDDEKPLNVPDEITVLIGLFCKDYAQCLVDATLHDKRPFDAVDPRTCGSMAAVEAKLIRELAEDIADKCCVTYGRVMGWAENDRDAFPARRKSARLTDDQRRRIRELRGLGMSYRGIAREVGVSPATVVKVVRDDGGADVVRGRT